MVFPNSNNTFLTIVPICKTHILKTVRIQILNTQIG